MATRFYFTNTAGEITPASGTYTDWEAPASPPSTYKLAHAGDWPGVTVFNPYQQTHGGTTDGDSAIARFISQPIGAQTITGTGKGQVLMRESATGLNAHPQIVIRVVSNDGTTVRGTLYAGDSGTGTLAEMTTTTRNWQIPRAAVLPITLSSVTAQAGDRILMETGFRADSTSTSSFGVHRFGSLAAAGGANDLVEAGTATTDLNNWFEFSANLTFGGATPASLIWPVETPYRILTRR